MPTDIEYVVETAKKTALGLQSTDKKTRKTALVDLEKFLKDPDFTNEELRQVFIETHMYTLNGFRDNAELVREQAIRFMWFFIIDKLPVNDFFLTYVSPVLVERIGSIELIEESEEIRLELVKFLQAIILKYSNSEQLKPFLGDCVKILCETVKDKHPAIKELSCRCVIDLAEALPRDFHMQAECLIKPLVGCFGHQRFKVRVEAINAVGEVIMHSSYKGLDEAVGPLAERLFDQIPLVRRTVAQVAARLLMEYRDRYSFFHKLLPLLLTGLNDEVKETRTEAHQLWEKVGQQYLNENEKDLKDKIDFLVELPKYYPFNLKRPNLGCRVLVQRNVSKISKALGFELMSWQQDIRVRCSQLLCSLALHSEEDLTQTLQDLLPAMYLAARDDDRRVVDNIIRASELMGSFVPTETWYKLILPVIEDSLHFGHLRVLYGFIKGAPKDLITNDLEEIAKLLSEDFICFTRKKKIQVELVKCVNAISEQYSDNRSGNEVGFHLFKILVALISLRDPDNTHITPELIDSLSNSLIFFDCESLWSAYTPRLLDQINVDPKSWIVTTTQRCIFETILLESSYAFGENLPKIADILIEALDPQADAESRLKTFWALSTAFDKKSVIFKNSTDLTLFFSRLISEVFVPSLVWHPGMSAESLRTMAASCLLCALTPAKVNLFNDGDVLRKLCDKLAPLLVSLMEDASYRSRYLAMECIGMLKKHACQLDIWTNEDLISIYPEILKRLDDPIEKVRNCALTTLSEVFKDAPAAFKEPNFRAHHELIIDTLLTHFDDDDSTVRDLVFDVIKVVAAINAGEVASKVERHKPLLCNSDGCNEILEYLKEFKIKE